MHPWQLWQLWHPPKCILEASLSHKALKMSYMIVHKGKIQFQEHLDARCFMELHSSILQQLDFKRVIIHQAGCDL